MERLYALPRRTGIPWDQSRDREEVRHQLSPGSLMGHLHTLPRRTGIPFRKATETGPLFRTSKSDRFSAHQDGPTGEVTRRIDPDTFEQPASGQVPPTRLGFMAFEPHPTVNEPLLDPTTAQRI